MASLIGVDRGKQVTYTVQDRQIVVRETDTLKLRADSATESRDSVANATGLTVGASVGETGITTLRSLNCVQDRKQARLWIATAIYESNTDQPENDDPTTDPVTWVPLYETKMERMEEPAEKGYRLDKRAPDNALHPITNSAGQAFRGRTKPRYIPYWEFVMFERSTVSDFTMLQRQDALNKDPVTIGGNSFPELTLRLNVLRSVVGRYYRRLLRFTLYRMAYNKDRWTFKPNDVGTVHADNAQDKMVPYYVDGEIIEGPLNGYGAPAGGYQGTSDLAYFDPGALNPHLPWQLEFRDENNAELDFTFLKR